MTTQTKPDTSEQIAQDFETLGLTINPYMPAALRWWRLTRREELRAASNRIFRAWVKQFYPQQPALNAEVDAARNNLMGQLPAVLAFVRQRQKKDEVRKRAEKPTCARHNHDLEISLT